MTSNKADKDKRVAEGIEATLRAVIDAARANPNARTLESLLDALSETALTNVDLEKLDALMNALRVIAGSAPNELDDTESAPPTKH